MVITFAGQSSWNAYNEDEKIFLPVIMYHSILNDSSRVNDYVVTPEMVENDLNYLKEHGYNAVFTEDIINYTKGGDLPPKPIIITADDGFYNNYTYLVPLLIKYDMKASISIVGYYSEVTDQADPHIPEY